MCRAPNPSGTQSHSQLVRVCRAPAPLRQTWSHGRKEAGLWWGEIRVELRQKHHYSIQALPMIIEQNNWKQQSQILLWLSSEENSLSNVWTALLCMCRQTQDLEDIPWSFPHHLLRLELRGLRGSLGNGGGYRQIRSRNRLLFQINLYGFLGLTYRIPKVLYICLSLTQVSFGLDFTINKLQGFFQTVFLINHFSAASYVWGSRPFLLPQLWHSRQEKQSSVIVSLAMIKGFCKWHNT